MKPVTSDQWISELGKRIAARGPKTIAEAWETAAEVYEGVTGRPVDRNSAYDIAVVSAAIRGPQVQPLLGDWPGDFEYPPHLVERQWSLGPSLGRVPDFPLD